MTGRKLRVAMLGLRGVPGIPGGVETHVEKLALNLRRQADITVIARLPYFNIDEISDVEVKYLWAPKTKAFEALVHTFLGVLYLGFRRPDIVHIHAIGPAVFVPLARLLGLKVVVTHHGADYERQKWGIWARLILRCGELLGMQFANCRIAISRTIASSVFAKYGLDCSIIPNGVDIPSARSGHDILEEFGVEPGKYVISVGRLVPEKRQDDLIEAFLLAERKDWRLVILGSADHESNYSHDLRNRARTSDRIVMGGYQTGESLKQLYENAALFVLPSSHEGLPIALLEGLGYGLPVLASNIPAHLEVELERSRYFELGNIVELAAKLRESRGLNLYEQQKQIDFVRSRYSWGEIAAKTYQVYCVAARRTAN